MGKKSLLGDYLTRSQAASELGVTSRTLANWEAAGEGPPITRVGARVLYRKESLLAWLVSRESNREPKAA
jgi:DNA-binding transcriptional MerR regulator